MKDLKLSDKKPALYEYDREFPGAAEAGAYAFSGRRRLRACNLKVTMIMFARGRVVI
jgi:hypothetical protein